MPSPSKVAFFVQPEFPSCRLHCHWRESTFGWTDCISIPDHLQLLAMPTSKVTPLCLLLPMYYSFVPPDYPNCRLHCHWRESMFGWTDCTSIPDHLQHLVMPTSKVTPLCLLLPMYYSFVPPEYPNCRLHCHWRGSKFGLTDCTSRPDRLQLLVMPTSKVMPLCHLLPM